MSQFPPPPPLPPRVRRFHRVPPAIFPAVLGLLGLVSAWRHAMRVLGIPPQPVEIAAGMVSLLLLGCAGAYAVKLALRPGTLVEDGRTLPGRTGLAALALCLIVEAGLLAGRTDALALALLAAGVLGLLALTLWVLPQRLRGTDTAGPVTPAMHLVFVGFVTIPGAALPLGVLTGAMPALLVYCVAAALVIAALTLRPLILAEGAPPLRPLQAIQLAPPAFVATGGFLSGLPALGLAGLAWAMLTAALLLVRLRWLTEGSFSGFWSAFTFPVTAFAGALITAYGALGWPSLRIAGGLVLVAATLYIPVIAYRVLKLWATGMLAAKTNAATV